MDNEKLDRLLNDIEEFDVDSYIDQQLARGDRSQSFHGEQMRRCRWCPEPWHGLPITKKMREMRDNPYALDEFGYPIMDPNYSYAEDDSDWICPGSDFHGPETPNRSWRLPRGAAPFQVREQSDHPLRVWRFKPPWEQWNVDLESTWIIQENGNRRVVHRAILKPDHVIPVPPELMHNYHDPWWRDVLVISQDRTQPVVKMKNISFEFQSFRMNFRSPESQARGENPLWVEFITDYDFSRHQWCVEQFDHRELGVVEREHGFDLQPVLFEQPMSFDLEGWNDELERLRNLTPTEEALQALRGQAVPQEGGEVSAPEEDGMEEGSCS